MYSILNIGSTGTGKSELIKNKIVSNPKNKIIAYDPSNDYRDIPYYDPKIDGQKVRDRVRFSPLTPFSEFLKVVKKVYERGYYCIVDEATGVFESNVGKDFVQIILAKRHINITFIMNFHSIQDVPPKIWRYKDLLILRTTQDYEKDVIEKWREGLDIFKRVQEKAKENPYYLEVIGTSNLTTLLNKK